MRLLHPHQGVLIGMLLSGWKRARGADDCAPPKEQKTRELTEAQPRALPEPLPSVTEGPTRAFEPAYSRRKSES